MEKPVLVLDLDHTLIHSMPLSKMLPDDAARLQSLLTSTSSSSAGVAPCDLLLLPNLHTLTLTKLRPFVHEFLGAASAMFELYVFTMGAPRYAAAVAKVLDPSGCLFQGRIIARHSYHTTSPWVKTLDVIPHPESSIIILDDTPHVWHSHLPNLIPIARYQFFTSTSAPPSLLASLQDECASGGALAHILDALRSLHADWQLREEKDVRKILSQARSRTLAGCKLLFPTEGDSFWLPAEKLGATCSTILDESVTHVIAGTQIMDLLPHNVHVVRRRWISAAFYTWTRPSETLYAADAVTPSSFSETTALFSDYVCTMAAHDDDHHVHHPAAPLIDLLAAAVGVPSALTTTTSSCSHHVLPGREHGAPSALPPLIH